MWRIYSLDSVLFLLHRVTGMALLVFLITHVVAISTAMLGGEAMFNAVMGILARPAFFAAELFLFGCVIFHAANGLRLILNERGIMLKNGNAFARATVGLTIAVWMGASLFAAKL